MKTAEEMIQKGIITEEQIPELLMEMSEEEAMEFLDCPKLEHPMTREQIIDRTLWMGEVVLDFLEETYPAQYRGWMVSETLLPMVEERVNEAKEMMNSFLQKHLNEIETQDFMERVQYNNQVYARIKEIVIEEILTRPLRFEVN